jgi:heptose-I-phosphate ethanolaminephosphotransferase
LAALKRNQNDKNVFGEIKLIGEYTEKSKDSLGISKVDPDSSQTFVLIIGESTGRNHMSLYGYYRKTNPKLESIKKQLYVFKDVVSPHAHTIPVLQKVLTFANFEHMDYLTQKGSMIDLFNRAGFKTYWISNQPYEGEFENQTTMLASAAKEKVFLRRTGLENKYDGELLPHFKKALAEKSKNKLIIIHLMGTHTNYDDRYPESYKHFTNDDIKTKGKPVLEKSAWGKGMLNTYDNAVRYNDFVIYQAINSCKKAGGNISLMYFSDHGEDVYDCATLLGHNEANSTAFMYEIPFIVWFSDKYKVKNQTLISKLPSYLKRPYQTDDVIHSILTLTNIRVKDYVPAKSIFEIGFKKEKRYFSNKDYDSIKSNYTFFRNILITTTGEGKVEFIKF